MIGIHKYNDYELEHKITSVYSMTIEINLNHYYWIMPAITYDGFEIV
jgi:hypothetical protein